MKFYIIPPVNHLDLMHYGDRYFCLAHLYLSNEQYANFFKQLDKDCFITLDNSAAERALVTEEKLLQIVKELQPNEVIAPDILFDNTATLSNLLSFINKMKNKGLLKKTNIFGCPQGTCIINWLDCYKKMLDIEEVSVIGLSKIAVPKCFLNKENDEGILEARHKCYDLLEESNLIQKPIHLLGAGDMREFTYYKNPLIRSNDSCNTVWSAVNDICFEEGNFKRIPTVNAYFDKLLTDSEREMALQNINWLMKEKKKCQ